MPDYTVSGDVDSMLRSADDAAIRSAIGVGTTDVPVFAGATIGTIRFGSSAVNNAGFYNTNGQLNIYSLSGSAAAAAQAGDLKLVRLALTPSVSSAGQDTFLERDAFGILAQRNGTNAQAFRVYNSTDATPATNYDRGVFDFKTTTNTLRIGTEKGGTYTTARPIEFVTGDVVRMSITAAGSITTTGDFYVNPLGLSGKIFVGIGSTGGIRFDASGQPRGTIFAVLDGVFAFTSSTQNDFNRLQLGGTTSAFPAIKRNGTGIDIRLADDSAFAPVKGKITTDTAYTATVVTPTGFLTLYDSTGTAYRVPCVV